MAVRRLAWPAVRIVSLLPSATEILFDLGAGDDVVGVTFECDHPPEARERRIVSTSALPEGLPPAEIDAAVRARLAAGEDLYHLDAGALTDLDADLVVTQDLCAVCAVDVSVVDDALAYLGCRAEVLTLDPQDLDEVLGSIGTLGKATGREAAAAALVADLRRRLDVVRAAVAGRPAGAGDGARVDRPAVHAGALGAGHGGGGRRRAAARVAGRAVGAHDLGGRRRRRPRRWWSRRRAASGSRTPSGWLGEVLAAGVLPDVPLWAVDANASFARPGPRLVDGVEALAAILHPAAGVPLDPALAASVRAAVALTERRQGGHVVVGQREVGDVGVGPDPLLLHRLRDDDDAVLQVPADDDLRRACGRAARRSRRSPGARGCRRAARCSPRGPRRAPGDRRAPRGRTAAGSTPPGSPRGSRRSRG